MRAVQRRIVRLAWRIGVSPTELLDMTIGQVARLLVLR
jgi:hypothetical protein